MAQVRRQLHNPSSSPRKMPSLPNSTRFPPPPPPLTTRINRQTRSFQHKYARSPLRATRNVLSPQTGVSYRSINTKY